MIAQYYYETKWDEGMPLFDQLPENYLKYIEDSMGFAVWGLAQAGKEFGITVKEFVRACRMFNRKIKKK